MDVKEELKNRMLQSGDIHKPDRFNSNWIEAFELYKTMTGDTHVSLKCGSCINKIKAWLLK